MTVERYLHRAAPIFFALAALGPGLQVVRLIQLRSFARTFNQYGRLPEIRIFALDWIVLILASVLLLAAILEMVRSRVAAPFALFASVLLWIYFGPALWAHIRSDGFFEPTPGRSTSLPWQQFVYEIGAMISALVLGYLRFRPSTSPSQPESKPT
jgi:hypothetical protein